MNPRQVAGLLSVMADTFSSFSPGEHTAEIWAESLSTVDLEDGRAAIRRLATQLDFAPSIARFLEECRLVKRNRQPAIQPGRREPTLPREESARIAAALSRGLKVAADMIPAHDHKPHPATGKRAGWVDCPACSTADARRPALEAAIRSELNPEKGAP